MMDKVFIYKCDDYEDKNIKDAINNIVSSFDLLKKIKNKKVVIKANLVSAMEPDKGATTHPKLLKELTSYLLSKGCEVIIGDSPGGVYTKPYLNHVYKITKMTETGAKLNDNFNTKKTYYEDAKILKTFEYTSYLDEADVIIDFCKLKTHGMMQMSCAVKNMFGSIPGTMKPEYHYRFPNHKDFANMLIDIYEYFKPSIAIVDAIIGMEGNGPTMGDARKIGAILASENAYALDYICAKLIGLDPIKVETINQSIERKLFDKNNIEINDDINNYLISDFNTNIGQNTITFFDNKKGPLSKLIAKGSNTIFANKPNPIKRKCVGCKKCEQICPVKAIEMVNNKPKIDRNKCIKCYCCQEFCPFGAMVVKTSPVMKLLHKK